MKVSKINENYLGNFATLSSIQDFVFIGFGKTSGLKYKINPTEDPTVLDYWQKIKVIF